MKRLLKRFQRYKTETAKKEKRAEYARSRKEYVNLRKIKRQEFDHNRLSKLKNSANDPRTFWSVIRSVNRKSFIYNEISIQQWHDHFYHVFNDINNIITEDDVVTEEQYETEPLFNDRISREKVLNGIKHLKVGKAQDQIEY